MSSKDAQINAFFGRVANELDKQMKLRFQQLGQKCVNRVRDREAEESWGDITGNLRSSIGAGFYKDGKLNGKTEFPVILGGAEGAEKGKDYLRTLAYNLSASYSLAVVAGMNYASYVEDMAGKDVLASTEAWARNNARGYVAKAVEDTIYNANKWKIG